MIIEHRRIPAKSLGLLYAYSGTGRSFFDAALKQFSMAVEARRWYDPRSDEYIIAVRLPAVLPIKGSAL